MDYWSQVAQWHAAQLHGLDGVQREFQGRTQERFGEDADLQGH